MTAFIVEDIPLIDFALARRVEAAFWEEMAEMVSRLHTFRIGIHHTSPEDEDDDDEDPEKREYSRRQSFHALLQAFLASIRYPDCACLANLRLCPASYLLFDISLSPGLKCLHVDMYDELVVSEELPKFVEGSDQPPFRSLKSLTLTPHGHLEIAVEMLRDASCYAQEEIVIELDCAYKEDHFVPLWNAIIDPHHSFRLRRIVISCGDHYMCFLGSDVPFKVMRPLLSLHQLEEVNIDLEFAVTLTNADIEDIVNAWPLIRALFFGSCSADTEVEHVPVNLDGLGLFSRCAHLEDLELNFDATLLPTQPFIPSTGSKLSHLKVGDSRIDSVEHVASFLAQTFPQLKVIDDEFWFTDGWANVRDILELSRW